MANLPNSITMLMVHLPMVETGFFKMTSRSIGDTLSTNLLFGMIRCKKRVTIARMRIMCQECDLIGFIEIQGHNSVSENISLLPGENLDYNFSADYVKAAFHI